jgi:hypothetical protein
MKKNLLIILLLILSTLIFPQANNSPDTEDVLTANSKITEVRLNGFEDASFWEVSMPLDQGVIIKQARRGSPVDVSDDNAQNAIAKRDEKYGISRSYSKEKVLGVKVQYITRGYNRFAIKPTKPIVIEGVCQSISCFVAGRNYRHILKVVLLDYFGRRRELIVDKLNFVGWKELVVSIPQHILQTDYHFVDKQGIKFNGFIINCDAQESFGTYYIYFDELRAMTDIFNELTRDVDDMIDGW